MYTKILRHLILVSTFSIFKAEKIEIYGLKFANFTIINFGKLLKICKSQIFNNLNLIINIFSDIDTIVESLGFWL